MRPRLTQIGLPRRVREVLALLALLLAALSTIATRAGGQQPTPSAQRADTLIGLGDPAVQRHIAELEERWARAYISRDSASLGRLIAPEFFAADQDGVNDRAALLRESAAAGAVRPVAFADSNRVVRVYGDAAVVTALGTVTFRDEAKHDQFRVASRYTETWVRRNGAWQAVAGSYTPVYPEQSVALARLREADRAYVDALARRDSTALARLVADSAMLVSASGATDGKAELLRQLGAAPRTPSTATIERAFVSRAVGVTIGTMQRAGGTGRAASPAAQRFSRTWIWRASQWRLLAEQVASQVAQ